MHTQNTISSAFRAARKKIRAKGQKPRGIRFIDFGGRSDETFLIEAGTRDITIALENLDKQPAEAFEVFANLNYEVAIKQTRWLPFFHVV